MSLSLGSSQAHRERDREQAIGGAQSGSLLMFPNGLMDGRVIPSYGSERVSAALKPSNRSVGLTSPDHRWRGVKSVSRNVEAGHPGIHTRTDHLTYLGDPTPDHLTYYGGPTPSGPPRRRGMAQRPEESCRSPVLYSGMADLPSEEDLQRERESRLNAAARRIKRRHCAKYVSHFPEDEEQFEALVADIVQNQMSREEREEMEKDIRVELQQVKEEYEALNRPSEAGEGNG